MSFTKLIAYQKGFHLAMSVFEISKSSPKEEKYSLIDQIRRSSRSVCANIAEAYRKRRYEKRFISKLSDSDAENSETQVWLDFAKACGYISDSEFEELESQTKGLGKLVQFMINNPSKFGV